jgi:hypothetical protein
MRPRAWPLGSRRVDDGSVEEIPWSASSKAHFRELNLAAASRIRDGLEGRNKTPEVLEMVGGGLGPPSVVYEPLFDTYAGEHNASLWDRQARSASTGKFVRSRK